MSAASSSAFSARIVASSGYSPATQPTRSRSSPNLAMWNLELVQRHLAKHEVVTEPRRPGWETVPAIDLIAKAIHDARWNTDRPEGDSDCGHPSDGILTECQEQAEAALRVIVDALLGAEPVTSERQPKR